MDVLLLHQPEYELIQPHSLRTSFNNLLQVLVIRTLLLSRPNEFHTLSNSQFQMVLMFDIDQIDQIWKCSQDSQSPLQPTFDIESQVRRPSRMRGFILIVSLIPAFLHFIQLVCQLIIDHPLELSCLVEVFNIRKVEADIRVQMWLEC